MELQETLDVLNELGAEHIQAKTHIALSAIRPILTQDFTAIHPIQYAGFLTIIQGELNIDMTPLREALEEHNDQHNINQNNEQLFVYTQDEKNSKVVLYAGVAIAIFIVVLLFVFSDNDETIEVVPENQAIEQAQQSLSEQAMPTDETSEVDDSSSVAQFNEKEATSNTLESKHPFLLYPKSDLWIGVIDIDTKEKKDTITSKPYALDENKNLLISLGHGQVKVMLNGKEIDSSSQRRLRYLYQDGKLSQINLSEFKELNDGVSW